MEEFKHVLDFVAAILAHPNTLTVLCASLLFLLGQHYWREVSRKIRLCESKHSKCERRLGAMLRAMSQVVAIDDLNYDPRRKHKRRIQDTARDAVMIEVRRTLASLLNEIDREESAEEADLLAGSDN